MKRFSVWPKVLWKKENPDVIYTGASEHHRTFLAGGDLIGINNFKVMVLFFAQGKKKTISGS